MNSKQLNKVLFLFITYFFRNTFVSTGDNHVHWYKCYIDYLSLDNDYYLFICGIGALIVSRTPFACNGGTIVRHDRIRSYS